MGYKCNKCGQPCCALWVGSAWLVDPCEHGGQATRECECGGKLDQPVEPNTRIEKK